MPLTDKGNTILAAMRKQYGTDKGERVFYASINKGRIKGAEETQPKPPKSYASRMASYGKRG